MHFKAGVTLSLFCVLIFFSITECSSENCANKANVGGSVTIQLSKPEDCFDIKWKHANKIIIRKKGDNTGPQASNPAMDDKGSLRLQNVKMENAGEYSVECYSKQDELKVKYSTTLCVYDKIPKPSVNFTCQNGKPIFKCNNTSGNVEFSWYESGKEISTGSTFTGKDNKIYQCIVSNPFYNNTSDEVTASCSPKTSEGQKLFGFDLWIMEKKKCICYIQGEGSCASRPSSDGSLLESPPSSPSMVTTSLPSKESKSQTDQMQHLSLTMKPAPLVSSSHNPHLHLVMPPPLAPLDNSGTVRLCPQWLLGPFRRVYKPFYNSREENLKWG